MSTPPPLLEVDRISKGFPGVQALQGVSLQVRQAEVVAVIGENGAGKSTLMKILAGVQEPDSGQLRMDGAAVQIRSVREAAALGIALIHQELNLADNLEVGANIFLGREPRKFGLIDNERINRESRALLDEVGLECAPNTLVNQLTIGFQQMVEIAKALSIQARVLIMDEPTSSLSQKETQRLFDVVKALRTKGVAVIYISHRLGEVKELADRVVVLRDGRNAGELDRPQISHEAMVRLMVGRDLSQFYPRHVHEPGEEVLRVEGLRTRMHPAKSVSFHVKEREIVGIAGLVGAGRTELLQAIFGVEPALEGRVRVGASDLNGHGPIDSIDAGLALVPEDRKQQGLVLEMGVRENASLVSLRRDQRGGFLNVEAERVLTTEAIQQLRIKTPGLEQIVQYLSGGNQQKIVLAKWLAMKPRVLLLDEPTRGIDVGAKQEIYRLMETLAGSGMAVVFVSSELEEVMGMADRVLVMHEGAIQGELPRSALSEEAIMRLATGAATPAI